MKRSNPTAATTPRGSRRVHFVSDPSSITANVLPDPAEEDDLRRLVDMIADSGVDSFQQDVYNKGCTVYWTSDEFQYDQREQHRRFLPMLDAGTQPLQVLLEGHMGIQTFYELLFTYPDEIEAWMDLYHEQQVREHELVAESPVKVAIGYENTSMSSLSPDLYGKYVKKRLDDYADIIRGAGKAYLNHDCGLLKGVEDQIRDGHQNGRIDVAREPTGNFDYSRQRELTGDKVIIGGIDATAFTSLSPEEMKDHVREFLRDVAPGRYFALGSGDAIPMHTPPEVLAAVGEVIAEEGAYPLDLQS